MDVNTILIERAPDATETTLARSCVVISPMLAAQFADITAQRVLASALGSFQAAPDLCAADDLPQRQRALSSAATR
jgi:hypothetical protein